MMPFAELAVKEKVCSSQCVDLHQVGGWVESPRGPVVTSMPPAQEAPLFLADLIYFIPGHNSWPCPPHHSEKWQSKPWLLQLDLLSLPPSLVALGKLLSVPNLAQL